LSLFSSDWQSVRTPCLAAHEMDLTSLRMFQVAALHLPKLGAKLTVLSDSQAAYINVPKTGPFKPAHYRY